MLFGFANAEHLVRVRGAAGIVFHKLQGLLHNSRLGSFPLALGVTAL